MVKAKKKDYLEMAVNNADYQSLIDLSSRHRNKRMQFSFCDQLKRIKEPELPKLMSKLITLLMEYLKKNLDENATIDWTSLDPENCKMIGLFIQATIDIALAVIQCNLTLACRLELIHLAVLLHGIMLPMPDIMDYVKNCIAHYCEKLFSTGHVIDNCKYFFSNVLLYLLRKTLAKKGLKSDVKRLYSIRKILEHVIKMDGAPTAELWTLFKQCAVSQTYLSILEGQKFLALIMTLDIDRLLEIHKIIKTHLPEINAKTAMAYGRAYFEAWCHAVNNNNQELKSVIEISCLQDFIVMAIQSKVKHILPLIRKILAQYHIHKKEQHVSKMLYSMYQPIIWRYIRNPNGLYRANAAQLFLDIFPLEDPDMNVVNTNLELNDQLLLIRDLLVDDFPIVRITTVIGICVSMSVNWEVFPEEMLKTFFRIIVDDLSRDSATPEVRIAVVKGLKCLLENPLTVRCLVSVLPKMTGLFHDISENVRIAFCQLLLRVKKISAIKYFEIVPIHHLFARMEEDCHAVKKAISNLLYNSYFPKNEDAKVWLGRCLEIIKSERLATRVFFSYAACFVGMEGAVRFMVQSARAVHFYVKTKNSSEHIDMEMSNKENIQSFSDYINSLEEAVGFSNLKVVSSLMDAIAVLWMSLKADPKNDMEEHKSVLKMLVARMGQPLSDLCLYYKDTEAWESVFYLSSFLPQSNVPTLASLCFWRLKNLPPDACEDDYMTLIECLMNQLQAFELLNLIKEWIEVGLNNSYVPPPAKKQKRGKGKSGDNIYFDQPKPYLANRMLDSILNNRTVQKPALIHTEPLQEITYFSDTIKSKLEKFNARLINDVEADFLNLLTYNIIRITVFLHYTDEHDGAVPLLNDFIKWTDKKLLQHIENINEIKNSFTSLIHRICENLCKVMSDVTALGFFDPDDCQYLEFIYKLLGTGLGYKFALIASRFLYKHAASSQLMILLGNSNIMMQHHLDYLCKILVRLCNETALEKIPTPELGEVAFTLSNVMQIVHNHIFKMKEPTSQVFKCILKNILDHVVIKTSEIVEEMDEDPFDRLSFPEISNFFLSIINLKPKLIRMYLQCLTEMFKDSKEMDISTWIAYWMLVWYILCSKTVTQPVIKEISVLVSHLEKYLNNLYPREKDPEADNPSEQQPGSVPMQLFQVHCHTELIKLKSRLKSKLHGPKIVKN